MLGSLPVTARGAVEAAEPETVARETGLSLEEAVMTALENNRSVRAQRLQPLIAGTFEELERAVFDPLIFAEVNYSRDRSEEVSRATGNRFTVEGEGWQSQVGAQVHLPTGTDVQLGATHAQSESDRTPEQHRTRVGLTVTQALLQGRGLETNFIGIRQARLNTRASESLLRGFVEAFVAQVETAYWDLLLAQRQEEIFAESLEVAERQRESIEEQIQVGRIPETDRAAAEAEVALRRQALIDATSLRRTFKFRLLNLMASAGSSEAWQEPLSLSDVPEVPDWDLGAAEHHIALAKRLRPELEESRLQLQSQELEVVVTRNGVLPRLDLFINLGKSGYADTFGGSIDNVDGPRYDATVGLRFEYLVGNRSARAADRRADFVLEQAEAALANLEQLVELDVRLALIEVERAMRQVEASEATRRLQEEVARVERERLSVGRSTLLLVAQAQRDLLVSQVAEVEASIDVRKALVELYRLEGTLLRRRGIAL